MGTADSGLTDLSSSSSKARGSNNVPDPVKYSQLRKRSSDSGGNGERIADSRRKEIKLITTVSESGLFQDGNTRDASDIARAQSRA